jgi:hypothetical protein
MSKTINSPVDTIGNAILAEIDDKSEFQPSQSQIVYVFAPFAPLR